MTTASQTQASSPSIPGWIWTVGTVLALVVGAFGFYNYANGLRSTSVEYETALSNQYQDNQNKLSNYISGFYEQIGVANLKSEKLDQILSDAVKGRYDKAGGFGKDGGFFNAIREAYPSLTGLNVYDKIADYVSAGRAGYANVQSKLLDMLRSYDAWRQDGFARSWFVGSVLGIPSVRLVARIGENKFQGQDALDRMYRIVLTSDTVKAYETGTMEPLKAK